MSCAQSALEAALLRGIAADTERPIAAQDRAQILSRRGSAEDLRAAAEELADVRRAARELMTAADAEEVGHRPVDAVP